jgi:hypothetical protein
MSDIRCMEKQIMEFGVYTAVNEKPGKFLEQR